MRKIASASPREPDVHEEGSGAHGRQVLAAIAFLVFLCIFGTLVGLLVCGWRP